MTQVLSYNITDLSVVFFAKGRPYNVPSDHPSHGQIVDCLLTGHLDADNLIELADIKLAIEKADPTRKLEIVNGLLSYGGAPLHNVWAEKVQLFLENGHDFDPIFKALASLMENPSPDARERFPIFAERNGFGFLPDGRIGAFKAVSNTFFDHHSNKFDNSPGKTCEMPRSEVDADPNQTCSNGLHLGALEYVRNYQSGTSKIVFCAFWPSDVVAVPTDYNGTKMRVCRYQVLEEVDPAFVDEFLGARRGLIPETKSAYQNGYLKGFELLDKDDLPSSAIEFAQIAGGEENTDYLEGLNAGWSDAIKGHDFDDERAETGSYEDGYEDGFHDFDTTLSKEENCENYNLNSEETGRKADGYREGWNDAAAGERCRF